MMKKLATIALLGVGMWLSSCASNTVAVPPRTGAGGNWEAQFTGGTGQAALIDFVSNFSVGLDETTLQINSFSFYNANTCFNTSLNIGGSEHGTATLNTSASNQVTGSMIYTISGGGSGSTLTLTSYDPPIGVVGTSSNSALTNGIVTGQWELTGSGTGCTGSGTFVMCQEAVPNSTGGCGATLPAAKRADELKEP
jgi:predicted small secreted protein